MNNRGIWMFVMCLLAGGCASADRHSTVGLSDGSTVHTLHCRAGWAGCYQDAKDICGSDGYEEIDRVVDGKVTSAGHLARLHSIEGGMEDHAYSENARQEVFDRTVTIRCKQR